MKLYNLIYKLLGVEYGKGFRLKGFPVIVPKKRGGIKIGNNVTIYANATILGGDTYVKDGSTIHAGALIYSSTKGDNRRNEQ